jgi:hypothetical protein
MAVQSEFWTDYLIDRLYKDNKFLEAAYSDDKYVINGKRGSVVHINNPGSRPVIVKNRSAFPATAVQRADNDITYVLDKYTSDPTHITAADQMEISYPKIESVFGDHAGTLVETIADDMIIKWMTSLPAGMFINTTGAASAANIVTGQTGTRKVMVAADLKNAQRLLNLQNVPKTDRYALLESNMLDELTESLNINAARDFSEAYDAKTGVVGQLYGFKVMERSNVAIGVVTTNAVKALGAAVAGTDNVMSLVWQKDSVARAIGDRKFFESKDDPLYYGDIYSALIRAGGRRRRADDLGVIGIVKAA